MRINKDDGNLRQMENVEKEKRKSKIGEEKKKVQARRNKRGKMRFGENGENSRGHMKKKQKEMIVNDRKTSKNK